MADDQLGQPALVDVGARQRRRDTAVAQDGDPVRDAEDLAEVVRDKQHPVAFGAQPADRLEQPVDVPGGQGGRRFVEHDQQPPVPGVRQGPRDRDRGALAHAERADRGPDIGVHAYPAQVAAGPVGRLAPPDPAAQTDRVRAAEHHVVEDAQLQDQGEILVDEAQSRRPRRVSAAELERAAVQFGLGSRVGLMVAGEQLDERRLPRAVLPHEGVDLAVIHGEVHVPQRRLLAEGLRHVTEL